MNEATRIVQGKYDRIAPAYDLMESMHEFRIIGWRQCAWALVKGPKILEIGVGTGRNIDHYPPDGQVTGIDISPKMLARA